MAFCFGAHYAYTHDAEHYAAKIPPQLMRGLYTLVLKECWKRAILLEAEMRILLAMLLFATAAMGQSNPANQGKAAPQKNGSQLRDIPSEEEVSELLAKADQKVSVFEAAVQAAKSRLDSINPRYAANYLDAASTAHQVISLTKKNGMSAYRLVGILATLDDLSLDAANGSLLLVTNDEDQVVTRRAQRNTDTMNIVSALNAAGTSCNDIAELIFHATMRLVAAEEALVDKAIRPQ